MIASLAWQREWWMVWFSGVCRWRIYMAVSLGVANFISLSFFLLDANAIAIATATATATAIAIVEFNATVPAMWHSTMVEFLPCFISRFTLRRHLIGLSPRLL
ncbi:hypothetical protein F5Y14DRAFT_431558 [Nemania sp. NC0429]|nr:hypothetical protein F5Y14DRAFT_431558 [Nemania sp. NC0429]